MKRFLIYLAILLLLPLTFNGCGSSYDAEDCIAARMEHVGRIVDLQFRVRNLESPPIYPDGLDTVGFRKADRFPGPGHVWVPITVPIMKPLQQVWLKPDEHDRLMEMITVGLADADSVTMSGVISIPTRDIDDN